MERRRRRAAFGFPPSSICSAPPSLRDAAAFTLPLGSLIELADGNGEHDVDEDVCGDCGAPCE